ncbi:hypothetical protein BC831DRAFT_455742 [Entophlyctis helioformis]
MLPSADVPSPRQCQRALLLVEKPDRTAAGRESVGESGWQTWQGWTWFDMAAGVCLWWLLRLWHCSG